MRTVRQRFARHTLHKTQHGPTRLVGIGIYTTFTLPRESRKRACEFAERGAHGADCPNRVMIFRISPLLAGARLSPRRVNSQCQQLCRYRCLFGEPDPLATRESEELVRGNDEIVASLEIGNLFRTRS